MGEEEDLIRGYGVVTLLVFRSGFGIQGFLNARFMMHVIT